MVKEVKILKNNCKGFALSCRWMGERNEVGRLARSSYFSGWHIRHIYIHT